MERLKSIAAIPLAGLQEYSEVKRVIGLIEKEDKKIQSMSDQELLQLKADDYNSDIGKLDTEIYNCNTCNNKGTIMSVVNNDTCIRNCDCLIKRKNLKMIAESGISKQLEKCTFENYKVTEAWQGHIKKIAESFVNGWLFIGGQVGSGKSFLGTAVLGKLMRTGVSCRYMLWRDEITKIKALVNDETKYSQIVNELKNVKVLYIDDFFKTEVGKQPTQADINFAHELLNYRYINELTTIISSELFVSEIVLIDEAIGSRIFEKSKNNLIEISRDKKRNYRMK